MLENVDANIKNQYELLNILDGKASALLTFNAIALASISIWLGYVPLNSCTSRWTSSLSFCCSLAQGCCASFGCDGAAVQEKIEELDRVRLERTAHYRLAWKLSIGAVVCLIAVSVVHTFGTLLISTGTCTRPCQAFFSQDVFGNLDYRPGP